MNAFEFGFFDELEKIATSRDLVDDEMKYFDLGRNTYNKAESRDQRGRRATSNAQREAGTTGFAHPFKPQPDIHSGDPPPPVRYWRPSARGKHPGQFRSSFIEEMTPEEKAKFLQRRERNASPYNPTINTVAFTHKWRKNVNLPPYGMGTEGYNRFATGPGYKSPRYNPKPPDAGTQPPQ